MKNFSLIYRKKIISNFGYNEDDDAEEEEEEEIYSTSIGLLITNGYIHG